jgi:hypothetical protein
LTTFGTFSEVNRRALDKIDLIQPTVDFIKISGSPFTGKLNTTSSRQCSSFTKFVINLKSVAIRAVKECPAVTNAVANVEAIIHHRASTS